MVIVGVDPGLTGALSLLTPKGLQAVADMPVMMRGTGTGVVKNQVDAIALRQLLQEWLSPWDKNEVKVIIELQAPIGGKLQGVSSIFSLALTAGIIEGVVASGWYPHELVQPAIWKKAMGLTAKTKDAKGMARTMAQRMYPSAELHLVKHHNRAESILIARYGYQKYH